MKSQKLPKSKKPKFAERKRAFDNVLEAYRNAKDAGGIGAIATGDRGKGVSNPVRPSLTDFRCDCEKVFKRCLHTGMDIVMFRRAYLEFDSESSIEREIFAEREFGSGRHSLEQGMGALFIKLGIHPLHGVHGYFTTIRQPRGSV